MPVVPPESWNTAGSVGSMSLASARSESTLAFGSFLRRSAKAVNPFPASPSTMPIFTPLFSLITRVSNSRKS